MLDFSDVMKQVVCQVQSNSSLDGLIYSIWLQDAEGNPVKAYNTAGCGQAGQKYQLQANEEIIGVYGVKGAH